MAEKSGQSRRNKNSRDNSHRGSRTKTGSSTGNGEPDDEFEIVASLPETEELLREFPLFFDLLKRAKSELETTKSAYETEKLNKRQSSGYSQLQSEIRSLNQQLDDEGVVHQEEVKKYKDIESKLGNDLRKIQQKLKTKTREFEELQQQLKEHNTRSTNNDHHKVESAQKALDHEKILHQETKRRYDDLQKTIDQHDREIVNYKSRFEAEKLTMEKLKTELEETKTRLSKMMGTKLSDNNPNITDLSDKNRPSKLGERYQELYDNQWTDAFETVEREYPTSDENEVVGVLLKILLAVKQFCEEASKRYEEKMREALFTEHAVNRYISKPIPDFVNKALKDCRKAMALENVEFIYESFLRSTSTTTSRGKLTHRLSSFVKECVELCWLMTLQDPPVVFGLKVTKRSPFDTNVYRPYTTSGSMIEFVVWPPIYLHTNGPILCKGVAQGYKSITERAKSAPSSQTPRTKSAPGGTRSGTRSAYQPSDYDTHDQNTLGPNRYGSSDGSFETRTDNKCSHLYQGSKERDTSSSGTMPQYQCDRDALASDRNDFRSPNAYIHGTADRLVSTYNQHTDYGSGTGAGYQHSYTQTTVTPGRQTGTTDIDWRRCEHPSDNELLMYDCYVLCKDEYYRGKLGDRFDICRNYREAFPKKKY